MFIKRKNKMKVVEKMMKKMFPKCLKVLEPFLKCTVH
jgi:hypothetical protein